MAILPVAEGRSAERRIVNLAARLRDPGARIVDADVMNLSTDGFMAETDLVLETGTSVWLKLPGLEPQNSRVMWAEDGKTGFQFATPLHPATLEMIIEQDRKPIVKGHFGPQGGARR
ncbi:MAG TPA: pilus assembly protein PilZ [Allosphingosinicella sp.]|nr:pilus assembly protein PilZ [Allosphingosinicella sp.]